jgi:hypothetical protein
VPIYYEEDIIMKEKMKEMLEKLADRYCWFDDCDYNIYDKAGANIDDAYNRGVTDGVTALARDLLSQYKEELQ